MGTTGALAKDSPGSLRRDVMIAYERLQGNTYSQIASKFGISKATVSRTLQDEHIAKIVNEGTKQLVLGIPLAVNNYLDPVDGFLFSPDEKIRLDATRDILKMVGIIPSHTTNNYISNVTQVNNTILSPHVGQLLDGLSASITGSDDSSIIDADIIEVKGEE